MPIIYVPNLDRSCKFFKSYHFMLCQEKIILHPKPGNITRFGSSYFGDDQVNMSNNRQVLGSCRSGKQIWSRFIIGVFLQLIHSISTGGQVTFIKTWRHFTSFTGKRNLLLIISQVPIFHCNVSVTFTSFRYLKCNIPVIITSYYEK